MRKPTKKKDNGKPTPTALKKECLKLWSLVVRQRDGFTCQRCGSEDHPQAHHVFPKKFYPYVMFEPQCGVTLCRGCHFGFAECSAHERFRDWIIAWMGARRFMELKKRADGPEEHQGKWTWNIEKLQVELVKLKRMVDK